MADSGAAATSKTLRSKGDILFDFINYTVLSIVFIVVFYPLFFVLIASFSNPALVNSGQVWFYPRDISLEGYKSIFSNDQIMIGYRNSLIYTVIGVCISLIGTIPAAYALSRKDLCGRKYIMFLIVFTMYFTGGMIPTYLVVSGLHMLNTMWAIFLPVAIVPYNLIIARTFFQSNIPQEMLEAARLDGCDDFQFFFRMVIPLSSAVIAIMVLFYGVAQWNTYFNALLYIRDKNLYPLQLVLRNILAVNNISSDMLGDVTQAALKQERAELIKYVSIVVSSAPLLMLYPFVQKYFVKGVMIGSVKG